MAAGEDVVVGGGGNDVVRGGRGRDLVLGEGGDDTLYAKDSVRDRVWGRSGFDRTRRRRPDDVRSINVSF